MNVVRQTSKMSPEIEDQSFSPGQCVKLHSTLRADIKCLSFGSSTLTF